MKVKQFIKQETVLSVAIVLAAISAVFVPPDAGYISYIDLRTLAILFSGWSLLLWKHAYH